MSTWYSKSLGDGVAAFGPSTKIQEAFLALVQSGAPIEDVSVFSRYDLDANIVTIYFTPSAATLASAFGAAPCDKPTADQRLGLLVGDGRSWQVHFPGHVPGRG